MSDDCFVLAELATGWQLHFQPWTGVARIQDGCSVINSISANLPTQLYPGKLTARNPKFLEGWLQIKRHNQLKQTLKFPSALLILKQLTPKEKKYLLISILAVVHDYYYFASPSCHASQISNLFWYSFQKNTRRWYLWCCPTVTMNKRKAWP